MGADSPQVLAFAEQALASESLGRIEITVSNHCSCMAPHLSMNESYELSVVEDAISLTAHSRWEQFAVSPRLLNWPAATSSMGLHIEDTPALLGGACSLMWLGTSSR